MHTISALALSFTLKHCVTTLCLGGNACKEINFQ